jgi:polyvinyl alcohol dehydrogenase (cytochrome)
MRVGFSLLAFTLFVSPILSLPFAFAHPVDFTIEGEDFPTRTGGSVVADDGASGGEAWTSTQSASISSPWFAEHQGTYRIWIVARGVASDDVYPQMSVFVDGRAVGHFQINGTYSSYRMEDTVALGQRDLRIYFSNPSPPRAIFVDFARIEILNHDDPLPIWREVESFPTKTTGGLSDDARASAGRAWNLWANGHARMEFSTPAPTTYRASIWARGDLPDATPAEMALRVDGTTMTTFEVRNAGIWAEYRTNFSVPAGSHTLDVLFMNDMNDATGDRNLRLDAVKLLPIGTSAPDPVSTTRYEVEAFPTRSSGGVYSEATASGGKGWNQWSNGEAGMPLTLQDAQSVSLAIRARGSIADNVWPIMQLKVDGVVLASWDVVGGNYATYSDLTTLSAGTHTIAIAFTNDARTSTQDRNLYLDFLDVTLGDAGTSPPPPPPPTEPIRHEVENFPTKSNGGVYGDSQASGGEGWKQWSIGEASMPLTLDVSQSLEFTIRAKGTKANDIWPLMSLRIDDAVVAEWSVTGTYANYLAVRNLSAGQHTVAIGFSNDARTDTEDRNLMSDYLEVRFLGNSTVLPPVPPPTTLPPPTPGRSEWRQSGHDIRGSHFNEHESAISAANASRFSLAWSYATPRTVFTTPAVADGVAYTGDFGGTVYAINTTTGALVWKNTAAPGSVSIHGMAVYDGRLFHGKSGGEVIARHTSNGSIIWRVEPESNPQAFIWSSPVYHDGKLYVGVASTQESAGFTSTPTFRGSFVRIDAATGHVDWKFYIVPPGHTGGAMWSTAAVDPDARLVYFGTGNAYTAPAHENTDAIIALDIDTGAMRWSTQGFANDVWTANDPEGPDTDFAMPVMMWNTSAGDKVVGAGNKIGDFFALDHDTGALLYRAHPQKTGQGFFGPGAVAYGRLYATLSGDKQVIAMEPDTGRVLWRANVTDRFTGGVTVSNGAVIAGTEDGAVWAFHAVRGALLWKGQVPGGADGVVLGTPSVAEGTIFVPYSVSGSTSSGGVAAFRPS